MIQDILEPNIEPRGNGKEITKNTQEGSDAAFKTPPQQPQRRQMEDLRKKEQRRTTEKKEQFLRILIEMGYCSTKRICERAGINKDTFYDWRKKTRISEKN